jgi:hypothetical protein
MEKSQRLSKERQEYMLVDPWIQGKYEFSKPFLEDKDAFDNFWDLGEN